MSIVSVVPDLIDALYGLATDALPEVNVYDGYGVTGNAGDFLMIGIEDPDLLTEASSAESSQAAATMGTPRSRQETGTVTCVALSWNGDGDQKRARDAAFAIAKGVADLCRTTPDLGVTAAGLVVTGFGPNVRLLQNQDEKGAEATVIFQVAFTARI